MFDKRLMTFAAVAALALSPAAALGAGGEDQYCDPFEGCGTSNGGGGNNGGGSKRPSGPITTRGDGKQSALVDSVQRADLEAMQRKASASGAGQDDINAYRNAVLINEARAVLDAAGLSSLRATVGLSGKRR